jgi:polysaccharide pyruvyl transferase WcaK-like protein
MNKIAVFDTSISDYNLGNQIIMESVYKYLDEIFPGDFFFKLPYMEITRHTIKYLKRSDFTFFGGTNALTGKMESYRQWDLSLIKSFMIKDVILMGLGWWQYEQRTSIYTKLILKNVLSQKYNHSVRDNHTKQKLVDIGIHNVVNTGCPTLWELTPEHCAKIPVTKSRNVVFTFTDYHKNVERDGHMLKVLTKNYDTLYYWIQGEGDLEYINSLKKGENIKLVDPNLKSFDALLDHQEIDYAGTRLHAGIRALQKGRRSIIIGIDNRAIEMQRDFGLPVLDQKEIQQLDSVLNAGIPIKVQPPLQVISEWKKQFKK